MAGASFAARGIKPCECEWLRAHEALSRLAKEHAAVDAEERRWLLAALRSHCDGQHLGLIRRTANDSAGSNGVLPANESEARGGGRKFGQACRACRPGFCPLRALRADERTCHGPAGAIDQLRRSSNCALDDDSALLLMARHFLGGPRDEGRASYQIALCLCAECGKGQQQARARGRALRPRRDARCDFEIIGAASSQAVGTRDFWICITSS
jgi:hypothetical protein